MNKYRSELRGDVIYYTSDGADAHEWRSVPSCASAHAEYLCTRCGAQMSRSGSTTVRHPVSGYAIGQGVDAASDAVPCGQPMRPVRSEARPLTTIETARSILLHHFGAQWSPYAIAAAVVVPLWIVATLAAMTLLR